jgi:hypothetical protein
MSGHLLQLQKLALPRKAYHILPARSGFPTTRWQCCSALLAAPPVLFLSSLAPHLPKCFPDPLALNSRLFAVGLYTQRK